MEIKPEQLKEILISKLKLISEVQFKEVRIVAKKENKSVEEILAEKGLITDEHLGQIIAAYFIKFPFINLREQVIADDVLKIIPELVARSKGLIAFARTEEGIKVGMLNPNDLEIRHLIEKKVGQEVLPYFVTKRDLEDALSGYKPSLKGVFEEILGRLKDKSLDREQRDELTIKVVDTLLQYGYENRASDIHIEPQRKKTLIRFRIDGVLHNVLDLLKDLHELILMRIKILSKMRTDEHRAAQDGKFRFDAKEEMVDVRVSVVPVTEGENVVMRLLSEKARRFTLEKLGFPDRDFKKVRNAIEAPYGMILATGPTGCGKTTTLYAILKILNKPKVNITSIEDPIEYDVEGVSQIQVNPKTNLTFAKGLRAVVRQDPDIIMIGEIRDDETAGIAINSAMTGHLVLSTMHANTAATNLPRLMDMGIEPFLAASAVNVIIAQRLVRKICPDCVEKDPKALERLRGAKDIKNIEAELCNLSVDKKIRLFKGAGCNHCNHTGYRGRVGIFEVLEMEDNIRELVIKRASADEIEKQARKNGMTTMLQDGLLKILYGITTLDEVFRVTRE